MKTPSSPRSTWRTLAALLACVVFAACHVVPPAERATGPAGAVRADTRARAAEVSELLEKLEPRVRALLPDVRRVELEVWVQESPRLYAFANRSYEDADGFWASSLGRIHLRDSAESLERTLAHELTHALLGDTWEALPGTLEEGLCDWVSAELCPDQALSMRAGRLSAATLGTGGMELEVALLFPAPPTAEAFELGYTARVLLHGGDTEPVDPMAVFGVRAGLSTTHMDPAHKKAFYGLSYLLVARIVERTGLAGLHGMCVAARNEGLDEVPAERLLLAAGLGRGERRDWRRALDEAFGERELGELLATYPHLVTETVMQSFGAALIARAGGLDGTPPRARIGLRENGAAVELAVRTE